MVTVIPYSDEDEAIALANGSAYGLAGSVWTSDTDHGYEVARRIRAGTFGINQYSLDAYCPVGGVKGSGIGREFGREGLDAFTELKTVAPPPKA